MRSPLTLLTDAFAQFRAQPKLYAGIYVIPAALAFLGSLYYTIAFDGNVPLNTLSMGELVIAIIIGLVLFVTSILMAVAMLKAVMEPSNTITSAYQYAGSMFFRYLALAILLSVIMFIGFLLFIIPGVIFMVWFAFAYYVLIRENTPILGALKRSKELTKGRWWQIFFRIVMLAVFSLIASLLIGGISYVFSLINETVLPGLVNFVFNLVLVPVSLMYMNNLYDDLRHTNTAAPAGADTQQGFSAMVQSDASQQSPASTSDVAQESDAESAPSSLGERDQKGGM